LSVPQKTLAVVSKYVFALATALSFRALALESEASIWLLIALPPLHTAALAIYLPLGMGGLHGFGWGRMTVLVFVTLFGHVLKLELAVDQAFQGTDFSNWL